MRKYIYLIFLAIFFGISGVLYLITWNNSKNEQLQFDESKVEESAYSYENGSAESVSGFEARESGESFEKHTQNSTIYVYVCGYVNEPGVYQLDVDARMYEAIDAAGGATDEGSLDYLELAKEVYDGQRIYVPSVEEISTMPGSYAKNESTYESPNVANNVSGYVSNNVSGSIGNNGEKININYASKEQLMTLTGIGEARAEAIIKYRESHGYFKQIEDIMNISGIKQAAFDKIKDFICV